MRRLLLVVLVAPAFAQEGGGVPGAKAAASTSFKAC